VLARRHGQRGRRQITPEAAKELGRIAGDYQTQVLEEAASRGSTTPRALRKADKRLRRGRRGRSRSISPATWDAATALGGLGVAADAYFGGAHPLAAGPLTGFVICAVIAAAGIVGKWRSGNRKD
jgi:hypothetical protein